MDRKIVISILVVIVLVASALAFVNKGKVAGNVISTEEIENLHEVNFAIEDMYCEACAYGVEAQFKELDGVVKADVDYRTARGIVVYDADIVSPETIASASTAYPTRVVEDKPI
jgi:copper chaperone CopZ